MSMSDEGRGFEPEKDRPDHGKDASAHHTDTGDGKTQQPQTPLPGLAAFGQMQRYAPVTQSSETGAEYGQQPDAGGAPEQHQPDDFSPHQAPPDSQDYTGLPDGGAQSFDQPLESYGEDTLPAMGAGQPGYESAYQAAAGQGQDYEQQYFEGQGPAGYDQYGDNNAFAPENGASGVDYALQPFEADYEQHSEVPLGGFGYSEGETGEQPFFHEQEQTDAEFLAPDDYGEEVAASAAPAERKGRKILMAASGLIGVLALGGALAFAYKIGGDSNIASADNPPLIQADNSPVKVAPDEPGGKEFPHKNKKIYERLQGNEGAEENEKLVPRQEEVASTAASDGGAEMASAQAQQDDGASAASSSPSQAAGQQPGAPRKVKTLVVRQDGSIVPASESAQEASTAALPDASEAGAQDSPGMAVTMPQSGEAGSGESGQSSQQAQAGAANRPDAGGPNAKVVKAPDSASSPQQDTQGEQQMAAATPAQGQPRSGAGESQSATSAPVPQQKPTVPKASARASTASAAGGGEYVVQVAARKSQTDALAAFADMQQKYPQLLSGYRPLIQRADLGDKGVWYRLNVGPVESKQVASTLCQKLKSAGMNSCLVRSQ